MPPTRGHDLKHLNYASKQNIRKMPPTRGHDLKHKITIREKTRSQMPPTRGHDLKRAKELFCCVLAFDAPHTGARLETTTLLYRKAHFRPILGDFAASLLLNKRAKRQNISAAYLI